jgi:hypothetical protein
MTTIIEPQKITKATTNTKTKPNKGWNIYHLAAQKTSQIAERVIYTSNPECHLCDYKCYQIPTQSDYISLTKSRLSLTVCVQSEKGICDTQLHCNAYVQLRLQQSSAKECANSTDKP